MSSAVVANLVAVLALVHPDRADIAELRKQGVGPATIATLYPPVFAALPRGLREALRTPEQLSRFLILLSGPSVASRLETLSDREPSELYEIMAKDIHQSPRIGADLQALAELADADQSRALWRCEPQAAVTAAVLSVEQILWLAANWPRVQALRKPTAVADVTGLTDLLRSALAA